MILEFFLKIEDMGKMGKICRESEMGWDARMANADLANHLILCILVWEMPCSWASNLNLKMFSLYLLAYNILRVLVFELARILLYVVVLFSG